MQSTETVRKKKSSKRIPPKADMKQLNSAVKDAVKKSEARAKKEFEKREARQKQEFEKRKEEFEKKEQSLKNHIDTLNGDGSTDFSDLFAPTNGSGEEVEVEQEREDIFSYIQNNFINKGQYVTYLVKRDGQFLGELRHPLSWAVLQKQNPQGGHFTVQARDIKTKQIRRTQTELIASIEEKKIEEPQPQQPQQTPPIYPIQQQPNILELLQVCRELLESNNKEKVREDKEDKRNDASFVSSLVSMQTQTQQMQNENQKQTMDMILKMQDSMTRMIEKSNSDTAKIIEKMDDKSSKFFDTLSNKSKGEMGVLELLTTIRDAEQRGSDQLKTMMEYVEAKAEEKYENNEKESGSIGEKVIGALLPKVVETMTAHNQTLPQPQPQPQSQRRSLPFQPAPRNPASQTPRPEPTPRAPAPRQHQTRPQDFEKNPLGLANSSEKVRRNESIQKNESPDLEGEDDLTKLYDNASSPQKEIAALIVPELSDYLAQDLDPKSSAGKVISMVADHGWSREELLEHFTFDFMFQIAKSFGIAEIRKAWFEEFYAHIKNSGGVDAERPGEPTIS